jgi:hypothetical protein
MISVAGSRLRCLTPYGRSRTTFLPAPCASLGRAASLHPLSSMKTLLPRAASTIGVSDAIQTTNHSTNSPPSRPAGTGGQCNEEDPRFTAVALLVIFIATQPQSKSAAHVVRTIGAALVDVFDAVLTFFSELL